MAWEISHTQEAWDNARSNLEHWTRDRLITALADDAFEAQEEGGHDNADQAADVLRDVLANADQCDLVEMTIASISTHQTCSNGGHDFWIDRQGYHTVSVSLEAPALTVCPNCEQYQHDGDCVNDCVARGFA